LRPMPTIVISYRRSDSSAIAGRIFDRLAAHFGDDSVFMDVDNIPVGVDFRSHIDETLHRSDILVAVIGVNWLGHAAAGSSRLQEKADPVRVEIETAVARKIRIIPVLVDGAKMPDATELPAEFGNFAYLNAAEVATGRDFRAHMERLIEAINRTMAAPTGTAAARAISLRAGAHHPKAPQHSWRVDITEYFVMPLILLLVAHHMIVNAFNLDTKYLWIASAVVPCACGFALYWFASRSTGTAIGFAIALGIVSVAGMTLSQSLNSGDPIMPQSRFEWLDNINFVAVITFSFLVGHALGRGLRRIAARQAINL
jgi:TIR domain